MYKYKSIILTALLLVPPAVLHAGQPDIVIADFEDPDYGAWETTGEAFGTGPVKHSEPKLMNNILGFGLYGAGVDGGQNTFDEAFPGMTWDKNLFVGYGEGRAQSVMDNKSYPAGSLFEPKKTADGGSGDADWPAVGFVNYAGGDYRLAPTSKYKGLGTDGKDLGADVDALNDALKTAR